MQGPVWETAFKTTVCHSLEKIACPDTGTTSKPGTLGAIKRIGGIWALCARCFDTLPAQLRPGISGEQLDLQHKSLNAMLWGIYENNSIPTALANKLCLGAASLKWGGCPDDGKHILAGPDFATYTPSGRDRYKEPPGRALETAQPHWLTLETWRRNALNQPLVFASIYSNIPGVGLPHLKPRLVSIGKLYQLHSSNPDKYTLKFTIETRG